MTLSGSEFDRRLRVDPGRPQNMRRGGHSQTAAGGGGGGGGGRAPRGRAAPAVRGLVGARSALLTGSGIRIESDTLTAPARAPAVVA
ncbi:hypothetical protein [Nocardia gipuzkoensis]|uniref:hypothetical protein n=1 Tax=Nocardia gipuzkoensis TaxID=2749991 RepID=UPI0024546799|nr:hypothetical protein [Nocardia gipuzkoensis]